MHSRIALASALVASLALLAGCGSSDTGSNDLQGQPAPAIPNDPSELPGAAQDPDSPSNPNSSTPPAAPTTPNKSSDISLALDTDTPATDLGTSLDIMVTVTNKASTTGSVTLTATGLPTGVTATFDPPQVTYGAAPVSSKLTIAVPYTTVPSAPGAASAIVITATSDTEEATANANFKVNPKVTLTMPVNTAALLKAGGGSKQLDTWGGPDFGAAAVPLYTQAGNGITFLVKNLDSTAHEVHGSNGFPHGSGAIPPGQFDSKVRVLDPAGGDINSSGYIHGETNGTSVGFKVLVYKAP